MDIDISIIIPVYNNKNSICRCLNSILYQKTKMNYEIIIVDDGSTDNTVQIIKKNYIKYNNIKLLFQSNQGAGSARNVALQYAKGKYIFFIDGDDYIESNSLNFLYREIIRHEDTEIIVFLYKYYDEYYKRTKRISQRDYIIYYNSPLKDTIFSFETYPQIVEAIAYPWNKLYLRSFIIKNKIRFSETKVHNDIFFNISSYVKAKKIKILYKCLYVHSKNSMTGQLTQIVDERRLDVLHVFQECEEFINKSNYNNINKIEYFVPYLIFKLNLIDWIISRVNVELKQIFIDYTIKYLKSLENEFLLRLTSHWMISDFIRNLIIRNNIPRKQKYALNNKCLLLSIIVPVYNVENYLQQCLESIANQTLNKSDYEVILIDDKSIDNSVTICRDYCKKFSNFHLIELPKNTIGGAGIPSNKGIEHAQGEYIGFVDSDDYIEPGMFQAMLLKAIETKSDLIICDFNIYNHKDNKIYSSYDQKSWQNLRYSYYKKDPLHILKQKTLALSPVPWRKIYRKDFLNKFNIRYPEGNFFYEDNPLHWFSVVQANSIDIIDVPFITHRLGRPGQTMDIKSSNRLFSFIDHGNTIVNFLKSINKYDDYKSEYIMWLVNQNSWILPKLGRNKDKYITELRELCQDITNEDIKKTIVLYKYNIFMFYYIGFTIKGYYFLPRIIKIIMVLLYSDTEQLKQIIYNKIKQLVINSGLIKIR